MTQRDSIVNSPQKPKAIKSLSLPRPSDLTLGMMTYGRMTYYADEHIAYREIGA